MQCPDPTPEEVGPYRPVTCDPAAELAKELEDPAPGEAYAAAEKEGKRRALRESAMTDRPA